MALVITVALGLDCPGWDVCGVVSLTSLVIRASVTVKVKVVLANAQQI